MNGYPIVVTIHHQNNIHETLPLVTIEEKTNTFCELFSCLTIQLFANGKTDLFETIRLFYIESSAQLLRLTDLPGF